MSISKVLVDKILRLAIGERNLVQFEYGGKVRISEPHDYGIQNGVHRLLTYQVEGSSTGRLPGWRWIDTDEIAEIKVLNRRFAGGRSVPSGKHHTWDELFIRVKPSDEKEPGVN